MRKLTIIFSLAFVINLAFELLYQQRGQKKRYMRVLVLNLRDDNAICRSGATVM